LLVSLLLEHVIENHNYVECRGKGRSTVYVASQTLRHRVYTDWATLTIAYAYLFLHVHAGYEFQFVC